MTPRWLWTAAALAVLAATGIAVSGAWTPKPTRVLGWRSPWSGDENDPRPWTYRVWVRAHWADMRLRHRLGFHAWRQRPLGDEHCDWCGANR